jgi:uncharacterized membrane protein YedE/YeeE
VINCVRLSSARLKTDLSIIWVVLFVAAGIVFTLLFSHFDTSMPVELLAP